MTLELTHTPAFPFLRLPVDDRHSNHRGREVIGQMMRVVGVGIKMGDLHRTMQDREGCRMRRDRSMLAPMDIIRVGR